MILIGYEIRERYGNDPERPIPNYPLGIGTVTMDTSLCRPCLASGCIVGDHQIFLISSYDEAIRKYLSIANWAAYGDTGGDSLKKTRGDYNIFAYSLNDEVVSRLADMERRLWGSTYAYFNKSPIASVSIPSTFELIGYDVVRGLSQYDRWESELANEGIPREDLEKHGALNDSGLYGAYEDAKKFLDELVFYAGSQDKDKPFVAEIKGSRKGQTGDIIPPTEAGNE